MKHYDSRISTFPPPLLAVAIRDFSIACSALFHTLHDPVILLFVQARMTWSTWMTLTFMFQNAYLVEAGLVWNLEFLPAAFPSSAQTTVILLSMCLDKLCILYFCSLLQLHALQNMLLTQIIKLFYLTAFYILFSLWIKRCNLVN